MESYAGMKNELILSPYREAKHSSHGVDDERTLSFCFGALINFICIFNSERI